MLIERVNEFTSKIWKEKDSAFLESFFHKDLILHTSVGIKCGSKHFYDVFNLYNEAFSNLQVEVINIIESNNIVMKQWKTTGVHTRDYLGIPASNLPISYSGVTVYRFEKELVVEYWAYLDKQEIIKQIS